jgi:8-oxo-dGTP diphosphatase
MDSGAFTIRVYAVLINEQDEVLLMNESYRGISFTKFPGGGLKWGEGTIDTINRELNEELGLENVALEQLYTPDFFVNSYFDTATQVISIYFKSSRPISKTAVKLETGDSRLMGMKWQALHTLTPRHVTFPIDKKVVELITK